MTAALPDGPPAGKHEGSIYDLGYRGYEGPRLGRRAAIWALLTHSLRTAYGLGRNTRSKVMPVGLTLMALITLIKSTPLRSENILHSFKNASIVAR